jgi:hypothetical protein
MNRIKRWLSALVARLPVASVEDAAWLPRLSNYPYGPAQR